MFLPDIPGHLINGRPLSEPAIDLAELAVRFERFLHDVYHRRPHGTTGEEPLARWRSGGFLPSLPESREALDIIHAKLEARGELLSRRDAHRIGLCVDCKNARHSAGRPRCDDCHRDYMNPPTTEQEFARG